jgi:hypothetical protein
VPAAASLELGHEGRRRGALVLSAALAAGAAATLARGRATRGFRGRDEVALTPSAALSGSLALHLDARWSLVAGLRVRYLLEPPEIWDDRSRLARLPAIAVGVWTGLRARVP